MRCNSLLALVFFPAITFAQAPPASPAIRASLQPFVDAGDLSGAVAVVGRADGVLAYEALGQADLAAKTPMANDSLSRRLSVTSTTCKSATASCSTVRA